MKKIALLGLIFAMFASTNVSARVYYDWSGKNAKKNLEFSNQVIAEVLTPEEMSTKVRIEEFTQSDGDHVEIVELLSGTENAFEQTISYYLNELFQEKTHDQILKNSRVLTNRAMERELLKRGMKAGKFEYEMASENPQDIIYVTELKCSDKKSDFSLVFITREVQIKKWKCVIRLKSIASKMSPEKKAEWIQRLKNNSMINEWIAKNVHVHRTTLAAKPAKETKEPRRIS